MLHGLLDTITSSSYIEGWAFDDTAPLQPLTISVRADGKELAQGIANLYRPDLVEAGHGTGWSAFRLKLSAYGAGQIISLWSTSSQEEICRNTTIPYKKDEEVGLFNLQDLMISDPTVLQSIEQLRGCNAVFASFIAAQGIDMFVRHAYLYIFGRSPDASANASNAAQLRSGILTPYELLRNLYESEEFRSSPRQLKPPSEPGFVFRQL